MDNNKKHNIYFDVTINKERIRKVMQEKLKDYEIPEGVTLKELVDIATKNTIDRTILSEGVLHLYETKAGYKTLVSKKYNTTYYIQTPNIKSGNPFEITLSMRNLSDMINTYCIPSELMDLVVLKRKSGKDYDDFTGTIKDPDDEILNFINSLGELVTKNYNKNTNCIEDLVVKNFGRVLKIFNPGKDLSLIYVVSCVEDRLTLYTIMYSLNKKSFLNVSCVVIVDEIIDYLVTYYDEVIEKQKELSLKAQEEAKSFNNDKEIDTKVLELKKQIVALKKLKEKN